MSQAPATRSAEEPRAGCLTIRWLGRVAYAEALELQQSVVAQRRRPESGDTLLVLEHEPVITLGRGADPGHVLASSAELAARGIERFDTGRGGDVTYHGPGQLVGYPIVALAGDRRDVHRYLRDLEEALIRTVAAFGVAAGRVPGRTGVWVGREKLAAIGIRLSTGWIAWHGFALNVSGDLEGFSTIVPCGLAGCGVTSLARLTGREPELREVAARVAVELASVLGLLPVASRRRGERLALGELRPVSCSGATSRGRNG